MTYAEATEYLFNVAPLFQNIGSGAYKEGLYNTQTLDAHFGYPHKFFRSIHVAGTNGKGSCSHTIAAILQDAGYKVGLYTSPHLVDFRERIRVNGVPISEERVISFVESEKYFFEPLYPSFFELTTALAFLYFREQNVDVAVVEVGLGGRLDCTNIISPDLSIITNISYDHTQFLGNTLEQIAKEKAGIIKPSVPVVIGETNDCQEVKNVFVQKALENSSPIYFADEVNEIISSQPTINGGRIYETNSFGRVQGQLGGLCQEKNTATIITAINLLRQIDFYKIADKNVLNGFAHVCNLTGLMGRWQIISHNPFVICDTGHNIGGIQYISEQLQKLEGKQLRMVIGMVNDKDVHGALSMLPSNALYYFTQASVKRAMPCNHIANIAKEIGLCYKSIHKNVQEAYLAALNDASTDDIIFVGGSSFIVADLLSFVQ